MVANGFEEERLGGDNPPATHYRLGDAETGFYAEFLTPLKGGEYARSGQRNAARRIAGIVSQQLRHLEVLLNVPWIVRIDQTNGFPFERSQPVQVANPAGFLAHKILIHDKRSRAKFAKDVLYIHDTLETFGARLQELKREWHEQIKVPLHANAIRAIERGASGLFRQMNDSVREAALMARGRKLSSEAIQEACNFGLRQIFS